MDADGDSDQEDERRDGGGAAGRHGEGGVVNAAAPLSAAGLNWTERRGRRVCAVWPGRDRVEWRRVNVSASWARLVASSSEQ